MRILHIEDDASDALFIQRKLASTYTHLEYLRVQSLEELKTSIPSFEPDVILSDHQLNGFTSKEIFQIFKDSWHNCPFILITDTVSEDFAAEALRNGIDDYIVKNRIDRLPKVIDTLLLKNQLLKERDEYINQIIESETRYRDLLYSTTELIHSADLQGNLNFVNQSWKRFLGYSSSEVINRNIFEFIADSSKTSCEIKFQRLMKGEKVEDMKLEMIAKDGQLRKMEGLAVPRYIGNYLIGSHAFLKDITEKEEIQSKLIESEKRYALAIAATSDGIIDLNIKNKQFYLSNHCFEILDLAPQPISISNLHSIVPSGFYLWVKNLVKNNGKKLKNSLFDQDIEISSNPSKWVNIKAIFNHKDCRINGSIRNITEKKIQEIKIQNFNKNLEIQVDLKTKELKKAISLLTSRNKEIQDSIHYAKRIHDALTSHPRNLDEIFPNSFILNLPKDVIGGDFAWFQQVGNTKFIAAADCTGHGVPGALLSVVATILLDEAVLKQEINNPSKILEFVNKRLLNLLNNTEDLLSDGLDIALCAINPNCRKILFSGANRPIYFKTNNQITVLHGDKISLGEPEKNHVFSLQTISYMPNDQLFMHSDGITSQFGGKFGKKLKRQHLLNELEFDMPMPQKYRFIRELFDEWKGDLEQTDDVLVIGITLPST